MDISQKLNNPVEQITIKNNDDDINKISKNIIE